jgi:hypothetical protein
MTLHHDARRGPASTGRTRYGNSTLAQTYGRAAPGDDEELEPPAAATREIVVDVVTAPV